MYCRHGVPATTHACTQCWRGGAVLHDAPLGWSGVQIGALATLVALAVAATLLVGVFVLHVLVGAP